MLARHHVTHVHSRHGEHAYAGEVAGGELQPQVALNGHDQGVLGPELQEPPRHELGLDLGKVEGVDQASQVQPPKDDGLGVFRKKKENEAGPQMNAETLATLAKIIKDNEARTTEQATE